MGIRGHTFSVWMFLASTPGLYVGAAQTPSLSAQDIAGTTSRTSKVWHVGDSPALLEGSHRSIRLRPLHSQPTGGRVELLPVGSRATHPKQVIRPANRAVPQGGSPALEVERIQNGIPSTVLLLALVDGPVGTPDRYAVPNDRTLSISAPGFLANDIDLNGEGITAVSISDPAANGALAAFADGSFSYTPDAGFIGTDTFAYRMRDASDNLSDPIQVTIEVLPAANRGPVGTPDAYTLLADTTFSITAPGFLANDIDPDGEPITAVSILDPAANGALAAFADGSFSYTPAAGFTGTDTFAYRMRDASDHFSDPVTVTLEVIAGNRAPIGVSDAFAARINTPLSIPAPGFLANDIDLDGEAIQAVSIQDSVDNGTLVAFADGSFTYTPNPNFRGTDSFAYRMRDASGNLSDPVTVLVEVFPAGITPVGTADRYAVPSDRTLSISAPGFLANDIDLNGEAITAVSIQENVNSGTLVAFADGSFSYTPDAGFTGTDTFAYRMRDASDNLSDPIQVTIEVLPAANRGPVGTPDAYTLLADTTLSITGPGFLANDIDPDGEPITAVSISANVHNGTLVAFADGSFTYTPNAGFIGTDTFAYRMQDASDHLSDPVTVTLEVIAGNRAPIGVSDAFAARINTPLSVPAPGFLANDIDLDGEAIQAVSIQDSVDNGTLVAFADGSFTYTPNPNFRGTDSFAYRMRDASDNLSDPVTVIMTVIDPNRTCIDDLAARAKSGKVQLTWTHTGVHHYNVYRATVSGGPYVKIGATASTYSTYLDNAVSNGTTYYYVVRQANVLDEESCESAETSARPAAR